MTAEGVEIYSRRSIEQGGTPLSEKDVSPPARHRLFRASAEAMYILDDHDHRVEVRF